MKETLLKIKLRLISLIDSITSKPIEPPKANILKGAWKRGLALSSVLALLAFFGGTMGVTALFISAAPLISIHLWILCLGEEGEWIMCWMARHYKLVSIIGLALAVLLGVGTGGVTGVLAAAMMEWNIGVWLSFIAVTHSKGHPEIVR